MFCSRIVGRRGGFTLAKDYGPRTWKSLAVFVVAACFTINGQSSPKQTTDPAVAALGSGFVSDTAQVNGTTLHYVRGGAGPAIILLHGFPEDWYAYHRIMPQLAKQFTVVAVDLRGIGGSAATAGGYDAANMAEDVHQLAGHLHLEHVYVLGHDIGGMVAYAFARRYPETSRGVMMLDAPLPGLGPWDAVKADRITWHINFQQTPGLPEQLLAGREAIYLRYFLDSETFSDADVARYARAYAAPDHLRAALEIYRAFPANEKFNAAQQSAISVPLVLAPAKTRLFRSSCQVSPMRCGRMGAQTLRSKSSRTAYITSRMSSPMLWLNSSNGMPRYNDDYSVLCGGTRRTYVESQGGKGSVSRSTVLDDQDLELDISSTSQNQHHRDSRREPDETKDS